jgi:high-affinity iron transporter
MRHTARFFSALLVCAGLLALAARGALAQESAPWQAAEELRQTLFDAQKALILGNNDEAQQGVRAATVLFDTVLSPALADSAPEAVATARDGFAEAQQAATDERAAALAIARSRIWTSLLDGSYQAALQAVAQNQPDVAQSWLLLREFRTATRFSRPDTDATVATTALRDGRITVEKAQATLKADLLDTYQARLNDALAAADEAAAQQFAVKQAEATGLAQGYWSILAPAYSEQRGAEAQQQADTTFAALVVAAQSDDTTAFTNARAQVDIALKNFRAAPLAVEEQARRAGQLIRYLNLVPVEYGRGVKNGQVTLDIEIQEAITFRDGAAAAFEDLRLPLQDRDAAKTEQIATLLDQLAVHLQNAARRQGVVPPETVTADTKAAAMLLNELFPPEWQRTNAESDFDVLASVLDQVEAAVKAGQYPQAESARLEAYAVFDSGPEPRLLAFAPDMVAKIDGLFWQGHENQIGLAQAIATRASAAEIKAICVSLDTALAEAQRTLGDGQSAPAAVAGNAAVIVFREGLEAVLILASITASMVGAYQSYRRPVAVGAIIAFAATGLTWVLTQTVLLSLNRFGERLEAIVSLIAIAVLLLITNWFFHNVYWTGWIARFHSQKRRLIGGAAGQMLGLVLLGFTSIYREGFETVLFLQALVLESGPAIVLQGVGLGLLATTLVGVITFALQTKLPYKKMLIVTGIMIGGVLLIMVGNTIHVLQAVGWMTLTPIRGLTIPYWMGLWFGLFPTWEGVGFQFAAAAFVIGSYYLAERMKHQSRETVQQQRTIATGIATEPPRSPRSQR